jgi:hypothetical protein
VRLRCYASNWFKRVAEVFKRVAEVKSVEEYEEKHFALFFGDTKRRMDTGLSQFSHSFVGTHVVCVKNTR